MIDILHMCKPTIASVGMCNVLITRGDVYFGKVDGSTSSVKRAPHIALPPKIIWTLYIITV